MLQDLTNLGKHFLPPAGCGSIFSAKHCWDAWRSGNWLVIGYMAVEAKLLSPILSTFEELVLWCMVRRYGDELGPFCWPVLAAGIAISVHLIDLLSILLRCNGFFAQDSESCSISDGQQTTKRVTITSFWCNFGFGKCFGVSSWSNHWAGYHRLSYKIHFSSHGLLLHTIREDTSKQRVFFSWSIHEVPT